MLKKHLIKYIRNLKAQKVRYNVIKVSIKYLSLFINRITRTSSQSVRLI